MEYTVFTAFTEKDFAKAKNIVLQYAEFLNADLSFQNFEAELSGFNIMYGPPKGSMILAEIGGAAIGAVGLRFLSEGVAEMKRMFVVPKYQGLGVGSALMVAFLEKAKVLGYRSVKLDTIPELDQAIKLYKKFGFKNIDPYCYNPHPEAQFFELLLS